MKNLHSNGTYNSLLRKCCSILMEDFDSGLDDDRFQEKARLMAEAGCLDLSDGMCPA